MRTPAQDGDSACLHGWPLDVSQALRHAINSPSAKSIDLPEAPAGGPMRIGNWMKKPRKILICLCNTWSSWVSLTWACRHPWADSRKSITCFWPQRRLNSHLDHDRLRFYMIYHVFFLDFGRGGCYKYNGRWCSWGNHDLTMQKLGRT